MMKKYKNSAYDENLRAYLDQVRKIPLLTFEEEQELARRITNGDEAARKRFVEANLRLVIKNACSFLNKKIPVMDLIQEGNIGLIHAVEKFDYRKQIRFSTYATWWIRRSISRYLSINQRIIRLPLRKEELCRKIQYAHNYLNQLLMRSPNPSEIAEEIGVQEKDVEHILNLSQDIVSLENNNDENDSVNIVEFLEDLTYCPERALMKKCSREAAVGFLNMLKEREKNILMYRYQLDGDIPHTLRKIGDKMGLSTETVRQIEFKALKKLRSYADELKDFVEAI